MRVGITGHQNLEPLAQIWLLDELRIFVRDTDQLVGVSSLAAGADQLFAAAILLAGRPLEVVLPFAEYADVFAQAVSRTTYGRLLASASNVVTLPRQTDDEQSFLEAGRFIVRETAMMVAIWDGKPARGPGGTGDIVEYALALGRSVLHLHPHDLTRRSLHQRQV